MIKLKAEVNKSATMRDLRKYAEQGYKDSWQPELQVEAFMKGAEALLNLLHLPRVTNCAFDIKPIDTKLSPQMERMIIEMQKANEELQDAAIKYLMIPAKYFE